MSGKSHAQCRPAIPAHERQIFQFGALSFDVEEAHRLLRETPRLACRLPVDAWARLYGLDDNPASLIAPAPNFDRAYAMRTDLSRPVILALLATDDGIGNPILIDGCHRLYKAYRERVPDLPAFQLTISETRAIRIL
ncbi:hypothetical protein KGA66_27475 [Actinocrinis puniceicyclus]|uniref:Uncharacterized protein n=1 Tax=Actinocrinis puniceicyclus TaxID=977794 RepID=A0A8J7WQV3_9ACTN|nr:hypothetical protein [Actinocrinis puniceicyclus]MBS2966808.1 hypothetical protein [Actinocrinis puniceicyclus]